MAMRDQNVLQIRNNEIFQGYKTLIISTLYIPRLLLLIRGSLVRAQPQELVNQQVSPTSASGAFLFAENLQKKNQNRYKRHFA